MRGHLDCLFGTVVLCDDLLEFDLLVTEILQDTLNVFGGPSCSLAVTLALWDWQL